MSNINIFEFEKLAVRVVSHVDGEPWFVAADVCKVLEISNPSQALTRLDADEQALISNEGINSGAGNPNFNIINESGLYRLILGSRKPEAKRFKKWVTSLVLPSIRKTGGYSDSLSQLSEASRAVISVIVKAQVKEALMESLQESIPILVHSALSNQQTCIRRGVTAGQFWKKQGLPVNDLHGYAGWFGNRLADNHCSIVGHGRAEVGGIPSRMFDPDKAAAFMKAGGMAQAQRYIAGRRGQTALFT